MKQIPVSSNTSAIFSGSSMIFMPRASSTSAAPHFEEAALFPCFATATPAAAATIALVEEILNVFDLSPPVPTISSASRLCSSLVACALIESAQAAISSIVSPFVPSPIRNAAV